MFENNGLINARLDEVDGFTVYTVDNFFKNPHAILDLLNQHEPVLWKNWETPSYNGIHFADRRHCIQSDEIIPIQEMIAKLCNREPIVPNEACTNITQFNNKTFNNYKDNFWYPHRDEGFTCIIYLNHNTFPGTNLYRIIENDELEGPEHFAPWRSKTKYQIISTIEASFNNLILLDAKNLLNGMAVVDDTFFHLERRNMVMFFK